MSDAVNEITRSLLDDETDYEAAARVGPRLFPRLLQLITGRDEHLASKAASLAGMIPHERALEVLGHAARHPKPLVRIAAAGALKGRSDPRATAVLARLLEDPDPGVRRTAVKSIAGSADPSLRRRLAALRKHDPSPSVRELADQELGQDAESPDAPRISTSASISTSPPPDAVNLSLQRPDARIPRRTRPISLLEELAWEEGVLSPGEIEREDEYRRLGGGARYGRGRVIGRSGYGRGYGTGRRPAWRSWANRPTPRKSRGSWSRWRTSPTRSPLRRPWMSWRRWRSAPTWYAGGATAPASEFVSWVQSSLNLLLGFQLPVTGVMDAATRDAIRRFQSQNGLPVDGIVGPETRQALVAARQGAPMAPPPAGLPGPPDPEPVPPEPPVPADSGAPPATPGDPGAGELEAMVEGALEREAEWFGSGAEAADQEGDFESANACDCQSIEMPAKGYFSRPLVGGHAWYTPKRGDYGERLARCVAVKHHTATGKMASPTQADVRRVWRAIQDHPCNRDRLAGRWFLPRFRRDRCTPGGPYYGSIYIPFQVSDGHGAIVGGPRCG